MRWGTNRGVWFTRKKRERGNEMRRAIFLLIIFISACSMSMPETQVYSLNLPNNPSSFLPLDKGRTGGVKDASIAILINCPRYLTQPYIAYRNSPYQLLISRYSKWDSSPDEMVRQSFRDTLSSTGLFRDVRASNVVPGGFYSLKINLKRFERLDEGNDSFCELAFDVNLLSPDGKDLYQGSVTRKVKLENKSFLALAKGLSTTLAEGIEEIRVNVEKSLMQ